MKWSRYLIRYQRKCKSHVAVIENFGYLQKIWFWNVVGEEMGWTWTHYPYMMIYISSASKCWSFVWFQVFSSEKLANIECFLPFFVLVLVLSFGARGMQFLVLFFMFGVVRYSLSLGAVGRDMERNQSQNQRMWSVEQDDNSGKGEKWEKREQSVEWWNEWGWLSICHIWKQECNITYYYGITMDILPTF